ncbi:cupin domain-containing protein [Rhodocytophaga aerolata]|uniref:Cupin domain-containing protein n=1 Tax=Rhodocytophaga aerolata TaxID=455078 RepID=A0ABT8RCR3_9BACT|nr:cupin domain-containing protein [Rhodocytophaga aerolata]MDO1449894.1 cupin domain-containing protein [Rhodocytophaga aerolata]
MVRKGDIIYNPSGRQTVTFIRTAQDTQGLLLQTDITIAPGGKLLHSYMHVHPKQTEIITVKSGVLVATVNGKKEIYKVGDVITIPPGVAHKLEIFGVAEELHFICEMKPALCTEILYETILALPQYGLQGKGHWISLLQVSLTLNKYKNHFYLTAYPIWLQKLTFFLLSPLALLTGYKAQLSYRKEHKQGMVLWQ